MKNSNFFYIATFLGLTACGDVKVKNWEPSVLGPVAKTEMTIGDGADYIIPYEFRQGASLRLGTLTAGVSNALGLLGAAPNVEVNVGDVGPFNSLESNSAAEAALKTAEITVRLTNNTGVTIVSGTKVVVKISTLTMPFIETTISQDIPPQTVRDIANVVLDNNYKQNKLGGASEVILKDMMSLSFENLKLRSSGQAINSNQSIEIDVEIKRSSFRYVTVKPGAANDPLDTSEKISVNFSGGETGVENIKDSLIAYMFNQTPVQLFPQIYFYENETDTSPFDSLFRSSSGVPFMVAANTSRNAEVRFAIPVGIYFQMLKKAKYMTSFARIGFISNNPNDRVTILDSQVVGFRLVLDSRLALSTK